MQRQRQTPHVRLRAGFIRHLENAHARYDEAMARYRQQVLIAFREVEDNLASLRILKDQLRVQDAAVQASTRASDLSQIQYRDGSVAYIEVIESERTLLLTRRSAVQLEGTRAVSTVNLMRALGGGWDLAKQAEAPVSHRINARRPD